ncbi:MAG: DUF3224 domain-containing protein [Phenylobacterium sp.]|uniref:DUF3224 domain-containing protein n=1 Tax=Phenylobacterium sp. TaxID=1871053 RepID=UPI0027343897|nr:DUF3224 domain-containing protein [Phenylobacterium sp.]MDP3749544.1 DUF3224 domain-containing protein [Phenylobacterium sp.]
MSTHARGTFDVKVTPQPSEENVGHSTVGRLALFKQFHGDLEGTAWGQMLTMGTAVEGSAGYVAMDHVSATLQGRQGTFALQHLGTMGRGAMQMNITVVPDSGADELVGISGRLIIQIIEGKHYYDFEYTLPDAPRVEEGE